MATVRTPSNIGSLWKRCKHGNRRHSSFGHMGSRHTMHGSSTRLSRRITCARRLWRLGGQKAVGEHPASGLSCAGADARRWWACSVRGSTLPAVGRMLGRTHAAALLRDKQHNGNRPHTDREITHTNSEKTLSKPCQRTGKRIESKQTTKGAGRKVQEPPAVKRTNHTTGDQEMMVKVKLHPERFATKRKILGSWDEWLWQRGQRGSRKTIQQQDATNHTQLRLQKLPKSRPICKQSPSRQPNRCTDLNLRNATRPQWVYRAPPRANPNRALTERGSNCWGQAAERAQARHTFACLAEITALVLGVTRTGGRASAPARHNRHLRQTRLAPR